MGRLHLNLLGGFEARLDDGPALAVPGRKAQALLAYLAMSRGKPHARGHIADLLWGLSGDEQARNSLRQTLHVLGRALNGFSGLVARDGTLALAETQYDADALALADAVGAADPSALAAAATRFDGDFLAGLTFNEPAFQEWLEGERRQCRDLAQTALRTQLAHLQQSGPVDAAINVARRLLTLDPLQEDVHRTLMGLLLEQRRMGDAVRQYQECRDVLQRELGLTYLFISHDLSVVYHMSDSVGVMYLGRLAELRDAASLFDTPLHPYTRLLLETIPDLTQIGRTRAPLAGEVPNPIDPPTGCAFHPRCPFANDRCTAERPELRPAPAGQVACHGVEEGRIAEADTA